MPHAESMAVPAPTIEPLRSQIRGQPNEVTKNTLIQISTENPLLKIYFTTDGTKPDAFNRLVNGREVTHKYKAPFGLKPGSRNINAIAYTRNGKQRSAVSTRQFDVLYTDSDLSLIGEEDEDATSTVLLSRRSGTDDNDAARHGGSSRYMEKLKRHLDQSATSSGSDLDYETPRSIRELMNEVETPHSVRNERNALRESDLSSTEWERLQELEEDHLRTSQQADYLRAREAEHELEYERAREREDQLLRYVDDEEYHETRAREAELYQAHQTELEEQERRRAWETPRADCDCDDDGATHITDFFYSPDNRLSNSYDRRHNEPYSYRSTGSKSDHDYGITGVVGSSGNIINGGSRQDPLVAECVSCTSRCSPRPAGNQHDIHAAYRRQVDNELLDHMMANRSRHGQSAQTDVLFDDDCAECRAAALLDRAPLLDQRARPLIDRHERPLIDRHEAVGRVSTAHISEVDRLFEKAARNDPLIARRRSRSPSPRRSHSPRLSRSRSRDRRPTGILKRGSSLERARSREREREGRSRSRERDGRSRSPSMERRRSVSRDRMRMEGTERGRSRSRDRVERRAHSRSPSPRHRGESRRVLDSDPTPRLSDFEDRRHRASKYESDPEVRSRSQRSKYTNLRDTNLSLEEIDTRLSQFEDSDSSLNAPRRGKERTGDRRQESGTALKKKKDSANLKKSSDAKKKPATKPPPSPPSSVSSSLSSSSSSASSDSEEKKLMVNGSKVKKPGSSSKGAGSSKAVVVPKVVKTQTDTKRAKKTAEGALNFFNDSGTQINFWGMSPEEIAQRLQEHPEMAEAMAAVTGAARGAGTTNGAARGARAMNGAARGAAGRQRGSAPPTEEDSDLDEAVDHFFITEARKGPAVKAARQTSAFSEAYMDEDEEDGFCPIESTTASNVRSAPLSSTQQADQHGIFSKLGDKVKSLFGGGDKKKGGVTTFTKVNYTEVKKSCRKAKKLWEDPEFTADDSSLFHTEAPQTHPFEWKRPHEICKNPQFIVDGASRFDVKQGVLGNCWLLAAVASLAGHEKLLYRVIYPEQSFQKEYAGIFRFQFWQYGEWVDVCIDDRLPTKAGRLVYMHSVQEDEFWSPLIEKAYAKLNGCYENLSGGLTSEAMTDFTGGLVESFNFREELPDNMFQILHKAFDRGSLMGCSIDASPDKMEQQLDNGLIIGHAYSITDVKEVAGNSGQHQLVRVRNPWGNHCEWTGAWSDSSKEWKSISEKARSKIGIATSHDGEFWMCIKDFTTHFQRVEICNQDRSGAGAWESTFINNAWVKNVSAGGCRNYPDTYPTNPQFEVAVTDMDEDDDEQVGTIILALLQKDRRRLRPTGGGNLTIGYDIFEVGSKSKGTLDKKYFRKTAPVASSPQYINQREVTGRHRLTPGNYVVVPTSFDANEEADFLLRVYSEKEAGLMESDVPTSVNSKITAKTMAAAHSAPGEKRKSQEAEQHFRARAGDDLEVDAYELLEILNSTFTKDFGFGSFNINSCRSMVSIRDTDATGMLGLDEFKSLWDDLVMWKQVFKKHDKDESGFFSSFELREALKSVGYNVSNTAFKNIVMRYSDRDGHVQFNDFLDCIVRLKTLFELHERSEQDGTAAMPLDTFIATFMYT